MPDDDTSLQACRSIRAQNTISQAVPEGLALSSCHPLFWRHAHPSGYVKLCFQCLSAAYDIKILAFGVCQTPL